jgi:hydrogenase-4 component F
MAYVLLLFPLAMAGVAFAVPSNRLRPWLLPVGGLGHLALVLWAIAQPREEPVAGFGHWLLLDALGKVVLGFLAVLFFICSLYAPASLAGRPDRPNRIFCTNLFASLATMTLVTLARHLGLLWVAIEATTLASAPAIYFNQNARSLEATWKYLLICSVGVALALFGTFFLAYSSVKAHLPSTLLVDELIRQAPQLSAPWLHAAFVLLLIGYGAKMGLAPMHTWKPDAYGEAPGLTGTLLAAGVTSCAFLAILRVYQICRGGAEAESARHILIFMGLLSMAVAAVFLVRQRDFKRMLAYSSVEHMGILALGIGIGGAALYGALLHLINNGLTKGVLFLSAGNIHRAYGSKVVAWSGDHATTGGATRGGVQGAIRRVPLSGSLFLAGFLAITGSPPFGPFVSEFTIVRAALGGGQYLAGGLFLLLLGVVFVGMGATVLAVVQGRPGAETKTAGFRDGVGTGGPVLLFMALVLMLGLYIPPPLQSLLIDAAKLLEGKG